jgi:butyrate kinase
MKILTINPGSTSTKIAVFEDLKPIFSETLRHSAEEIAKYDSIYSQFDFRKDIIIDCLNKNNIAPKELECCVGRGGLIKPVKGGVIRVSPELIEDLKKGVLGEHASNLGGVLAKEIAEESQNPDNCFIVDPVVVDEMEELARFSGHPELPRISIFHALNQKAVARRHARTIEKSYDDLNLVVVHLGGGVSVSAHKQGKVVDTNNALDGDGPFSPERSGQLPSGQLAKLCFSGKYTLPEVKKMITGKGGMVAYLGTNSALDIEKRAEAGDKECETVFKALAYQIAKEIGAMSTVMNGKVDNILITGGIAYSKILIEWIKERTEFIAPIEVYPGEDEMEALAEGGYYAMNGEYPINSYTDSQH